jgi:hypothetical protein
MASRVPSKVPRSVPSNICPACYLTHTSPCKDIVQRLKQLMDAQESRQYVDARTMRFRMFAVRLPVAEENKCECV